MKHWEIKARSYWLAEGAKFPIRVRVIEDTYDRGEIKAGETGTVTSRSNAGFSGILAGVELDSGRWVHISAGILQAI